MAIELNKKGEIAWTIGDKIFNIFMVVFFGLDDLFKYRPKGGSYEG